MKVISLFSGAGGLDLGFVKSGHEIVWANDIDADCCETYRRNIGPHIFHGNIRDIDVASIPDADIVIGGFPCQGFSCANLNRAEHDERNALYQEFLRVLEHKQPSFFVAENVRGLLSLSEGRVIKMIINDFESAGYQVRYELLNAADYGVPQSRWRVIILGAKKDIPENFWPKFPQRTHSKESSLIKLKTWVTISDALKGIPEPGLDSPFKNHVCSKYKVTNRNFTGHRRTDPKKPSPTILARGNGKGGVCAIQHPRNHRRLSVRESAIIQTFPNAFEFRGSLNSMYRQVGNAVPVRLAKKVAKEFRRIEKLLLVNR